MASTDVESSSVRKKYAHSDEPLILYTISFSHYCYMARWILDEIGQPYIEYAYIPGFHRLAPMVNIRESCNIKGTNVTPLLLNDKNEVIGNSSFEIAALLGPLPDRLEEILNTVVGPAVRTIVYFYILQDDPTFLKVLQARDIVPWYQRTIMSFATPRKKLTEILYEYLVKNEDHVAKEKERLFEALKEIEEMLSQDSSLLSLEADAPSSSKASLIALVSLLLPVLQFDGYEVASFEDMSESYKQLILSIRNMPVGQLCKAAFEKRKNQIESKN